ncbi:MAG: 3-dehydroquinate synthase [Candidatus Peregrinibacteria bacterium]|nr:3-dehydroquinate synthase [Candidatus Peregrinibacteria bacterium]
MKTIILHHPQAQATSTPVHIGEGMLIELHQFIEKLGNFDGFFILHDAAVKTVAKDIASHLQKAHLISVPSGEASKSLHEVERIASSLLALGATRQSLLLNVGGGMLTDLGGFVASMYMRGIGCVHIPTTLLGMVDASIGGKTGVDLGTVKNLLGAFHHPRAVIADIRLLSTLPDTQFCEGLVEVIKIAAMLDANFLEYIEKNMKKILAKESSVLLSCIEKAVSLKVQIVEEDERDQTKRLFLNFGHTIGHAVEAVSDFTISHGKAVSIGMIAEMQLADLKGVDRMKHLLEEINMPTVIPDTCKPQTLLRAMQSDKKVISRDLRIAVPREFGKGEIITLDEERFLRTYS